MSDSTRTFSSLMLDGPDRAPSRAMLYAVGFEKQDFKKPIIGIASTWSEVTPCNIHINKLAEESSKGADAAGGKAIIFNTITISDGISMGTEGMKVLARLPRGDRGLDRDRGRLRGHGRLRGDRRL
ncbi:MAG: dihydroxy-acid dehydratase [Luteolibacter sp.]